MEEKIQEKQQMIESDNEIDLIELAKRLWQKRIFIVKVTSVFVLLGLFIAIFSPEEYTAQCVVVPQTGESGASSSLSGLASLAGFSLGNMGSGGELSPMVYSNVVNNVNLQKELINTKIYFDKWEKELSLIDYFTNEEYQRVSILGAIKKYTIGLPGVILGLFGGEPDTAAIAVSEDGISSLSQNEDDCIKILKDRTSLSVNDKDGYVNISATMPEPLAAACLAEVYMNLLQKYVSEFKIEKAQDEYNFINQRFLESKEEYNRKQEEYARFRDANKMITSAVAATREEQIRNEYDLAYSLYSELSRQLIQAEIKVKENTPIFTVVEPVIVPRERSKPKRLMTLIAFGFLGGVISCGAVFAFDFLKKRTDIKYLENWQ